MIPQAAAEVITEGLVAPDLLLPFQYVQRVSKGWSGERRLMLAVLEEAVTTIFRSVSIVGRAELRLKAERWVFSGENPEWPCSFENVCYACELEPEYIRRGIAKGLREKRRVTTWMLKRTNSERPARKSGSAVGRISV